MIPLALLATGCASSTRVKGPMVEVHGVIRDREGVGIEGIAVCFSQPEDGGWRTIVAASPYYASASGGVKGCGTRTG